MLTLYRTFDNVHVRRPDLKLWAKANYVNINEDPIILKGGTLSDLIVGISLGIIPPALFLLFLWW
jgi:hypothetical protein